MSDQSSADLEREANAARERMAGTAESIRRKLTAGQMIDEFTDMFTGGDMSQTARNLKNQVRDNPLPIALVGAGIAWLAFGSGVSGHASTGSNGYSAPSARPPHDGEKSGDLAEQASSAMSGVKHSAKATVHSVSDTVGGMTDNLSATADRLRHSMLTGTSQVSRGMSRSASGMADQEPLLVAALGLVLGTAVGAMLPSSRLETEQVGPHAERLRKDAKEMVDKGMESAGRVASKAYDALKEEADRQGLTPGDGTTVGERVASVVKTAAQSGEDAAREELGTEPGEDSRRS